MRIRAAEQGDAAAIAAIWNREIRDGVSTFNTAEKTRIEIAELIAARGAGFIVAYMHGAVIGFATYFQFRGGPGYAHTMEHSIHLAEAARGQGTGRALMAVLEQNARAAGVHSLIAGIGGENLSGVAFHTRVGFAPVARLPEVGRKFGRWMDLVLMQKFL
ncbi:phosphinothricin acetyltransferase [Salinihabitans flavidus]|uniref:Phosphinothricin acetyltransferase n=1 Tax=Salinihabitans flavidus TaxID=569882 RepID=A0A1H8UDI5_9RHOB|nr:GNAT family N-acetyltransferase [Salinihabitans flavidus]SEP01289.1 phosphinothricin acetyltransferase [Salinihabitans flavidus]